eukprot:3106064-Amphidinium_carterae.1
MATTAMAVHGTICCSNIVGKCTESHIVPPTPRQTCNKDDTKKGLGDYWGGVGEQYQAPNKAKLSKLAWHTRTLLMMPRQEQMPVISCCDQSPNHQKTAAGTMSASNATGTCEVQLSGVTCVTIDYTPMGQSKIPTMLQPLECGKIFD